MQHALTLPGFAASRAVWPVWWDSARAPVRFTPMAKKAAARLYHEARRFERQTRQPGRQNGALGRNGLAVLHSLLFDFLNFRSGRCDPSIAAIARAACVSVASVKRGLARLKAAGRHIVAAALRRGCGGQWPVHAAATLERLCRAPGEPVALLIDITLSRGGA